MTNGFSGLQNYDDLFYALYKVAITVLFVYMFLCYDQTISFKFTGKEHLLRFKMSKYYSHVRTLLFDRFILDFVVWTLISFVSAVVVFVIPTYAFDGIVNSNGRTESFYATGYIMSSGLILIHHFVVAIYTKNWTNWMLINLAISLMLFFPLTCLLNHLLVTGSYLKGGAIYRTIFSDILSDGLYYLTLFFIVTVHLLAFYAYRSFEALVRFP